MLTDGYDQTIGIHILRDPSTKRFGGRLKAGHLVFDHPPVELIEIWNTQTGTALSCDRVHAAARRK